MDIIDMNLLIQLLRKELIIEKHIVEVKLIKFSSGQ